MVWAESPFNNTEGVKDIILANIHHFSRDDAEKIMCYLAEHEHFWNRLVDIDKRISLLKGTLSGIHL